MAYFDSPLFQNQFVTPNFSPGAQQAFDYQNVNSVNPNAYNGPNPYQSNGKTGFWSGTNQLLNPFYREPRFGNPVYNNEEAMNSVVGRPFDATVWAGQRLIAPVAAFGLANKFLAPQTFGGYFTGRSVLGGLGKGVFSGAGRTAAMGLGLGEGIAGGVGAAAGVMGSLAGSIIPQVLAAEAALGLAQKSVFDPYINVRRSSEDLRRNFGGITFSDSEGGRVSGRGLSYKESYGIATDISKAGARDFSFSSAEYGQIADLSARSGLLDMANSKQIAERVKGIANEIKLVMAISKDPSFQNALQELSNLQFSGASVKGGTRSSAYMAYEDIGRTAAMAGTTAQRLMSTVGAAGQSLYSSYGMTPYMGQLAAANIYASYAAGQRTGILSPAQMARMGGIENATQMALEAQIQGGRNPVMQMALYNRYFGGGSGESSLPGTIGQFGGNFAKNPMGVLGTQMLFGDQMIAKDIQANQGMGLENQLASVGKMMPLPRGKDGKIDIMSMVPIMEAQGMTRDQIEAFIAMRSSQTDADSVAAQQRASQGFTKEQIRQYTSQNRLYGGPLGTIYRKASEAWHGYQESATDMVGSILGSTAGSFGDFATGLYDKAMFGSSVGGIEVNKDVANMYSTSGPTSGNSRLLSENVGDWQNGSVGKSSPNSFMGIMAQGAASMITGGDGGKDLFKGTKFSSKDASALSSKINALYKKGDKDAITFLSANNDSERSKALSALISANKDYFGEEGKKLYDLDDPGAFKAFVGAASTMQSGDASFQKASGLYDKQLKTVQGITGMGGDLFASRQAIGQAIGLLDDIDQQNISPEDLAGKLNDPQYASLKSVVGGLTGKDLVNKLKDMQTKAMVSGEATMGIQAAKIDSSRIISNPNLIQNPQIRKQLQDAISKKDKAGIDKALNEYESDINGGMVSGTKFLNADKVSTRSQLDMLSFEAQDADKRAQLQAGLRSGQFDYSTYQNSLNILDTQKSNQMFSDAVDKFARTVDKQSGSKSDDTSSAAPAITPPVPPRNSLNRFTDSQRTN